MRREIVFDTETTGLSPAEGHRIVEIGCVELVNFVPTGRVFQTYINPEREMPAEAGAVTGITDAMLRDKPVFADPKVVDAFLAFIEDAALVAHNAEFDRAFINAELKRLGRDIFPRERFVDTLKIYKAKFPGAPASLDAMCKRFGIGLEDRTLHGALLDARLLATAYLELNGGREQRLAIFEETTETVERFAALAPAAVYPPRPRPLPQQVCADEALAHAAFLNSDVKGALWFRLDPDLKEDPKARM